MGLAEKRAVKEFQETRYPKLKKQIDQAVGFSVEIEVAWDTVTEDGLSHLLSDAILKVYFQPVIDGLKQICQDEMGREALHESLRKIVFCNKGGYSNPSKAVSFDDGVLTVDHMTYTNMDDVNDRAKRIVKILEESL